MSSGARKTKVSRERLPPRRQETKREKRIRDEIIVDAYGPEEQALGWYNYLEGKLRFPFTAQCIGMRAISPLRPGDEVEIVGMAPEGECEHEMFVETPWENRRLAIPLGQIEPLCHTDPETREAVADWHYWLKQSYQL
jgi:Calcium binding